MVSLANSGRRSENLPVVSCERWADPLTGLSRLDPSTPRGEAVVAGHPGSLSPPSRRTPVLKVRRGSDATFQHDVRNHCAFPGSRQVWRTRRGTSADCTGPRRADRNPRRRLSDGSVRASRGVPAHSHSCVWPAPNVANHGRRYAVPCICLVRQSIFVSILVPIVVDEDQDEDRDNDEDRRRS